MLQIKSHVLNRRAYLLKLDAGDENYTLSSKEEILDKYLHIETIQSVIHFHNLITTRSI